MSPEIQTAPDLRTAPGRTQPLPEWVSTTDRDALPSPLDWGNEQDRPPIKGRVDVTSAGFALGTATVTGYLHWNGQLGCWVRLDVAMLDSGERRAYFFGDNLNYLGELEDDDTGADAQPVPAAAQGDEVLAKQQRLSLEGAAIAVASTTIPVTATPNETAVAEAEPLAKETAGSEDDNVGVIELEDK